MATQTLTLKVPDPLYDRIRHRAEQSNRTVEAEMLDVLAAAVPGDGDLPPDLAEAIAALPLLDDTALWQAARSGLGPATSARLDQLHRQRQSAGLTDAEESELGELVRRYERAMLVRARAAALLHERPQRFGIGRAMSETFIPEALRDQVATEARFRCGYCLSAETIIGMPMELDHLIPESVGGPTAIENLWLACPLCNNHKGNRIAAPDPETGEVVRLFDPRRQVWSEHFRWSRGVTR